MGNLCELTHSLSHNIALPDIHIPAELMDTLMKYIYRDLNSTFFLHTLLHCQLVQHLNIPYTVQTIYLVIYSAPSNACALLKWHQHATARSGVGSIIRVLTDRKTVW